VTDKKLDRWEISHSMLEAHEPAGDPALKPAGMLHLPGRNGP
jgi:hypothetical protein